MIPDIIITLSNIITNKIILGGNINEIAGKASGTEQTETHPFYQILIAC